MLAIFNFYEIMPEFSEFIRSQFTKIENSSEKFKIELKTYGSKKENSENKSKVFLLFCKNKDEKNETKNSIYYFMLYYIDKGNVEIFEVILQNITSMTMKEISFGNVHNFMMAYGDYHGSITLHFFSNKNEMGQQHNFYSQEIEKLHGYKINCLQFSFVENDQTILLASGSNDRKIIISAIFLDNFSKENKFKITTVYKFV